jgi:hypothetical protein
MGGIVYFFLKKFFGCTSKPNLSLELFAIKYYFCLFAMNIASSPSEASSWSSLFKFKTKAFMFFCVFASICPVHADDLDLCAKGFIEVSRPKRAVAIKGTFKNKSFECMYESDYLFNNDCGDYKILSDSGGLITMEVLSSSGKSIEFRGNSFGQSSDKVVDTCSFQGDVQLCNKVDRRGFTLANDYTSDTIKLFRFGRLATFCRKVSF